MPVTKGYTQTRTIFFQWDWKGTPSPEAIARIDRKLGGKCRYWWVPNTHSDGVVCMAHSSRRNLSNEEIQSMFDARYKRGPIRSIDAR